MQWKYLAQEQIHEVDSKQEAIEVDSRCVFEAQDPPSMRTR
jgi:hypothetical protein